MDTTVEAGGKRIGYGQFSQYVPETRVHNIGLMEERRNYLIISSIAVVIGVILFGFGALAENQAKAAQSPSGPHCPKCNGVLEGAPQLCKHCRTELRWVDGRPLTPEDAMSLLRRRQELRLRQEEEEEEFQPQEAIRRERSREQKVAIGTTARKTGEGVGKTGQRFLRLGGALGSLGYHFDVRLKRLLGEENNILYRFVQVILYVVFPVAVAIVVVAIIAMKARG